VKKVLISRDSLHVIQSLFLLAVIYPFLNLTPHPPLIHFEALIKPISLIIGLTPDLQLANFATFKFATYILACCLLAKSKTSTFWVVAN